MSPTVRRPFASLDRTRMSLLTAKMNQRNEQNGCAKSWRTQTAAGDIENVDPATLNKPSMKRKRGSDEDELSMKGSKESPKTYRLTTLPLTESKHAVYKTPSTPAKPRHTLKPAGRSPKVKSCKISTRRSPITKARPQLRTKRSVIRPFSIATALSNGKQATRAPSAPASWFFEIHVDSEQDEMTNLVQHSTCVLDISDDEGKQKRESRGKENVPPQEVGIDLPRAREQTGAAAGAHKRDMMEDRSPLAELNAADFYGAGCNAFSCVIIHDDSEKAVGMKKPAPAPLQTSASQFVPRAEQSAVPSIVSLLETTASAKNAAKPAKSSNAQFEILEDGASDTEIHPATTQSTTS
ncbi:hypothetical protein MPDQ_007474 [Monascus purpureus]|uniref:Uncharacterized protein n=1 Tax=Monascus purpureus TaxID=5098 RepID=A0A507R2E6_MONPU|nr:hypothetical protein MPDQ_007474 [Monascus purpureus]